ncbi:hypothetical protein AJ79_01329 [Helicocarpus griseus UAMH5409]|uniref:Uncharacterized protein n=1 Tax=Helicocarpus griseus UAMH5409 TaxID=1447875 RepID=A0A2B7Y810_9EURO|nr:hypothetical protein AJ79_01329 [Helicocarpus griseus UAMH5409]
MSQRTHYSPAVPLQRLQLPHNSGHADGRDLPGTTQPALWDEPLSPPTRVSIDSSGSIRRYKDADNRLTDNGERKIVPLRQNRAAALWYALRYHAIPLGAALAFVIINIESRYLGANVSWGNLLQFSAKVHEILMQLSISMVMVAYIQYLLTQHRSGIPFGSIFSAYSVTRVWYLFSREFRASVMARQFNTILKIGFVLFVPLSILLATTAGPASAIAMMPRLVNFTVPDSYFELDRSYGDVYPRELSKPGGELHEDRYLHTAEQSPAIGWQYLSALPSVGLDQSTETGLWGAYPPLYPVEIPTLIGSKGMHENFRRTLYVQFAPGGSIATVQHVPTAAALSRAGRWTLESYTKAATGQSHAEMPQPFTSTICLLNPITSKEDARPLEFPDSYFTSDTSKVGKTTYTTITRQQLWEESRNATEGHIIWLDDIPSAADGALGALIIQPSFCTNGKEYLSTSACLVGGQYAPARSHLHFTRNTLDSDSSSGYRVENNLSKTFILALPSWPTNRTPLKVPWTQSITSAAAHQNRTVAHNILSTLPLTDNLCPPNGSYESWDNPAMSQPTHRTRPLTHESLLSALVANGMSHATGSFTFQGTQSTSSHSNNNNDKNNDKLQLSIHSSVEGWGWNMDGTAIRIAIPILTLYCLYTTVYVLYTFFTGRSSRAWDSLAGIVALAWNSRPSKVLGKASVRVSRTETFGEVVGVWEVEGSGESNNNDGYGLEMVFERDVGERDRGVLRRVSGGKAY